MERGAGERGIAEAAGGRAGLDRVVPGDGVPARADQRRAPWQLGLGARSGGPCGARRVGDGRSDGRRRRARSHGGARSDPADGGEARGRPRPGSGPSPPPDEVGDADGGMTGGSSRIVGGGRSKGATTMARRYGTVRWLTVVVVL